MRQAGNVTSKRHTRNTYNVFVRKPERNIPHRLENNIKINLKGTGCNNVDWIHLSHDRVHWRILA
jgi:hypothetical protein